jgi:flagellar protein FliS
MTGEHNNSLHYAAYKTAQHNASKCRQVVMLYDGAIKFVNKAIDAIAQKDIQDRYNNLESACNIILGLRSALDFENGREIAEILDQYYHSIDMRLITVHRNGRADICEQVINELKTMRDAWDEIDQMHGAGTLEPSSPESGNDTPPKPDTSSSSDGGVLAYPDFSRGGKGVSVDI